MAKDRYAVTCNGRPAFYASMYEDIRKCAMDLGWAVALHGSLKADMDIMAMPWTKEATNFETLVAAIVGLFNENEMVHHSSIDYFNKPHGRIVATIPIWEDFYLDISTIDTRKLMKRIADRLGIVGDIERDTLGGRLSGRTFGSGFKYGIETAIEIVKEEMG